MQSILNIKLKMETQAKQEFSVAKTALDEEAWNAIPAAPPGVSPEDRQVLQEALARLEPEERQVILLHAISGLKHREIAQLLERPLSTVLSKYHRGLKKMKALMKGESDQ